MSTIASEKISVFPAVRRAGSKPLARLMSEQALVGIVNKLINLEGFVISSSLSDDVPLEFNLYGYYFKIVNPVTSLGLGTTYTSGSVYAHIELVTSTAGDNLQYEELFGQDDNGNYTGLVIDSSPDYTPVNGGVVRTLRIAEFSSSASGWQIPSESKIRFSKDSLDLSVIDGGIIQ